MTTTMRALSQPGVGPRQRPARTYRAIIARQLARAGSSLNVRHVEARMLHECGTLDLMTVDQFIEALDLAVTMVVAAGPAESEHLARMHGL